eukprot:1959049-Prymnesium_polylepis.1
MPHASVTCATLPSGSSRSGAPEASNCSSHCSPAKPAEHAQSPGAMQCPAERPHSGAYAPSRVGRHTSVGGAGGTGGSVGG